MLKCEKTVNRRKGQIICSIPRPSLSGPASRESFADAPDQALNPRDVTQARVQELEGAKFLNLTLGRLDGRPGPIDVDRDEGAAAIMYERTLAS